MFDLRESSTPAKRVSRGGSAHDPKVVEPLIASREVSHRSPLSQREREVLALLAEGLSNAAVSDRLVPRRPGRHKRRREVPGGCGFESHGAHSEKAGQSPERDSGRKTSSELMQHLVSGIGA